MVVEVALPMVMVEVVALVDEAVGLLLVVQELLVKEIMVGQAHLVILAVMEVAAAEVQALQAVAAVTQAVAVVMVHLHQ